MFSSSSRLSEVLDDDDGYTFAANTSSSAMKSLNLRLILALYPPSSVLLELPHFFSLATLAISSSIIVTVSFFDTICVSLAKRTKVALLMDSGSLASP